MLEKGGLFLLYVNDLPCQFDASHDQLSAYMHVKLCQFRVSALEWRRVDPKRELDS